MTAQIAAGPFEWDLLRLVTSVQVLARTRGVDPTRAGPGTRSQPACGPAASGRRTEQRGGRLRITEEAPVREHRSDGLADAYRDSLPDDRRRLFDRLTVVDSVRQVVGVGSVGMRVHLVLLQGLDLTDPLFLQIKQAGPSVYEPFLGPGRYAHQGRPSTGRRPPSPSLMPTRTSGTTAGWPALSRPGSSVAARAHEHRGSG